MKHRPMLSILLSVVISFALWSAFTLLIIIPQFTVSPLSYANSPFPVANPIVHAGDKITITFDVNVTSDKPLPTRFNIYIVNAKTGTRQFVVNGDIDNPVGHRSGTIPFLNVPLGTPPGMYFFENLSVAHANFRDFYVTTRTQAFEVIP